MKRLLSRENVGVLAQLARSKVLLAFDFDGTLSPIVASRETAKMRAETAERFVELCRRYPCAIISGRSQQDVASRLDGAAVKYIIGNHGLEPGTDLTQFEGEVRRARAALEASLAYLAGIEIEDKRYSLALHFREAPERRIARMAITEAVERLPIRMRIVPGKLVVNVIPERAPNKAKALLELRTAEQAATALYVGDDVTDEDVFAIGEPERLLSVRVGESKASAADYFLRNQREIDSLLSKLLSLRQRTGP